MLSFLLACYGAGDEPPDTPHTIDMETAAGENGGRPQSRLTFEAANLTEGGKRPRGRAEIRGALEALGQHRPPPPDAGPLAEGLTPEAPFLVATFYDPCEVARCARRCAD